MQDGSESTHLHFLWQKEKGADQGERSTLPETTEIYKTRPERYVARSFLCLDVEGYKSYVVTLSLRS